MSRMWISLIALAALAAGEPPPPRPHQGRYIPATRLSVGDMSGSYPDVAIRTMQEGKTVVDLTIATDGSVKDCAVVTSSGHDILDTQTCAVARRQWQYRPAMAGGEPISSILRQTLTWKIPRIAPVADDLLDAPEVYVIRVALNGQHQCEPSHGLTAESVATGCPAALALVAPWQLVNGSATAVRVRRLKGSTVIGRVSAVQGKFTVSYEKTAL